MEPLLKDIGIPEYNKAKNAYKFKDTSKKMEEMKAKVDFSQSK